MNHSRAVLLSDDELEAVIGGSSGYPTTEVSEYNGHYVGEIVILTGPYFTEGGGACSQKPDGQLMIGKIIPTKSTPYRIDRKGFPFCWANDSSF